jgi:soluble lytic murein transglycosylase-like protein
MNNFLDEIIIASTATSLEPDVVQALVEQESNYNPWAWNPEQRYRYFWDVKKNKPFRTITDIESSNEFPPHDFPTVLGDNDQEWWAQQSSWGLMQVMGAVAREQGYMEPYLTQLVDPATNLRLGCAHLASQFKWSRGLYIGLGGPSAEYRILIAALAAYNGGRKDNSPQQSQPRNKDYALRVIARRDKIKLALK